MIWWFHDASWHPVICHDRWSRLVGQRAGRPKTFSFSIRAQCQQMVTPFHYGVKCTRTGPPKVQHASKHSVRFGPNPLPPKSEDVVSFVSATTRTWCNRRPTWDLLAIVHHVVRNPNPCSRYNESTSIVIPRRPIRVWSLLPYRMGFAHRSRSLLLRLLTRGITTTT